MSKMAIPHLGIISRLYEWGSIFLCATETNMHILFHRVSDSIMQACFYFSLSHTISQFHSLYHSRSHNHITICAVTVNNLPCSLC